MSMQPGGFLPGLEPGGSAGSDTKRLLVTIASIAILWVGFKSFLPTPPPPAAPDPAAPVVEGTNDGAEPSSAPSLSAATPALPEERRTFAADVRQALHADSASVKGGYQAEVTSHGAQLASFRLDGYLDVKKKDAEGKLAPIDLAATVHDGARLLALRSRGGDVGLTADAPYVTTTQDGQEQVFERLTASGVRVTRRYVFDDKSFRFSHQIILKNESDKPRSAAFDLVLVGQERDGERDEGGMFEPVPDALAGACKAADEREHFTSARVHDKNGLTFEGKVGYAGLDRHYFLAAVVPVDVPTLGCTVVPFTRPAGTADARSANVRGFDLVVEQAPVTLAPGEVRTLTYEAYFGPKQLGLLETFGHGLEENVDFGWFAVIARPMLWVLLKLRDWTGSFGMAILLLTFLMKALTAPLIHKSQVGMRKASKIMRELKPELDELQKKYGHDRTLLGQKQMEFYQKKGINPLAQMAGCLPILITMPIWFALYRTLAVAVELYQQPFPALGIFDLTQPDALLFGFPLLPFVVGALMLLQTVMTPPPPDQPQMKYMLWGMPVVMTFVMINMAAGLSIYMITNSVLTMAQTYYIKRKYP